MDFPTTRTTLVMMSQAIGINIKLWMGMMIVLGSALGLLGLMMWD